MGGKHRAVEVDFEVRRNSYWDAAGSILLSLGFIALVVLIVLVGVAINI